MVDIGMPLMLVFLSGTMVLAELPANSWRQKLGGVMFLVALLVIVFSIASTTGFTLRAAVPTVVPKLMLGVSLALMAVKIVLYVRNDARRLRTKQAAPEVQ